MYAGIIKSIHVSTSKPNFELEELLERAGATIENEITPSEIIYSGGNLKVSLSRLQKAVTNKFPNLTATIEDHYNSNDEEDVNGYTSDNETLTIINKG